MERCRLVLTPGPPLRMTLRREDGSERLLAELDRDGPLRDWLRFSGARVCHPVVDVEEGETIGAHYARWCEAGRHLADEDEEMAHALVSHAFVRTHWPLQSYGLHGAFFLLGVDRAGRGHVSLGDESYELDVEELVRDWSSALG